MIYCTHSKRKYREGIVKVSWRWRSGKVEIVESGKIGEIGKIGKKK